MATTTIKDVNLKIGTETQFQEKLKELPINTLVGTTDPIQESELDTSIITKLNKADNALPKPTNDTTGSAGQVLKKTASGSEWGDAPSGGGGGEAVTPSGATASATSGTFTSAEWTKLQADKNNYIWFNNEIYRLSDTGHEGTEGIWSYVHTGWDGTAMRDKSINVTVSTGAWTLVQGESGGGKLYLHNIYVTAENGYLNITFPSSRKEKFTFDELQQNKTLFTRDKTLALLYTDNTPSIYECDDIGFGTQADWSYLGAHIFKTYPYSPLPRETVTLGTYSTFSDTVTEL